MKYQQAIIQLPQNLEQHSDEFVKSLMVIYAMQNGYKIQQNYITIGMAWYFW